MQPIKASKEFIYIKYAICEKGEYYSLMKSENLYKTRDEAIKAAIEIPVEDLPKGHTGPYLLAILKPKRSTVGHHLLQLGEMMKRESTRNCS